ncbi:MAG: beta-galactosidase [Phycisphaerae bacterium]
MKRWMAGTVIVLAACGACLGQVRKFDFGAKDSPTVEGWQKVTQHSAYDAKAGFGWETKLKAVDVEKWWNPQYKDAGVITAVDNKEADKIGTSYVMGYRFFGWQFDKDQDKQGVDRLKTVPDDPIPATFIVDLPDGEYLAYLGLGDPKVSNFQYAPFKVSFNGQARIDLVAPGAVAERRVDDIKVEGGKLKITFEALPDKCNRHPYPWNKFVAWEANFLILAPKADKDAFDKEIAATKDKRANAYWDNFPKGRPPKCQVVDGYIVKDGKPFFRLLWHGWGWDELVGGYRFYCLTNTINNSTMRPFLSFDQYPDDNYRKLALEKVRLPDFINQANRAYSFGYLVNTYSEWTKVLPGCYRDPKKYEGDDIDVRGKTTQWEPAVWGKGAMEWASRVHTVEAEHTERHPAVTSHEIIEEYWLVPGGYSEPSKTKYRDWLKSRYGDIAKLNVEWGTAYGDFKEIDPPKKADTYSQLTANHSAFDTWKRLHNVEMVKLGYEAVKKLNPDILVAGGKGVAGTACYDYGQWVDVLHWYSGWNMAAARAATDKWNHVLCPVYVNPCGLHKVRGGVPVGTDPFYERYRLAPYSEMLTKVFEGSRAIFNEDYVSSPDFHYYHYTKQWKGKKHEGTLGGALEFTTDDLPDVYVEPKTLQLARFNQMMYRLAPVVLPTKLPSAQIALLHTPESFYLFDSMGVYSQCMASFERLCQMLHVRHDVLHAADLEANIGKYKVLVLTAAAECVTPQQAQAIRKFHDGGGTLVLLDGALNLDSRTLQHAQFLDDFRKDLGIVPKRLTKPGEQMLTAAGKFTPTAGQGKQLKSVKENPQAPCAYETSAGQTALAKIGDDAVMIATASGRCFVMTNGAIRKSSKSGEPLDANWLALFRDVFTAAGVKPELSVEGGPNPERVTAGVMSGKDASGAPYWVVGLANFNRDAQDLRVKIDCLPQRDGQHEAALDKYDVIDLTGERPIIAKDDKGGNHLATDTEMRQAKVLAAGGSPGELAAKGLDIKVEGLMGRVLVIRPAGLKVIVDAPAYTFKAMAKDVVIVPGDGLGAAGKTHAENVAKAIIAAGGKATVAAEADIKKAKTHYEIKVDGVLLETFDNEPLVTEKNLVLIGSAATNGLVKHLEAPRTFTYDKVLEKVTAAHPGPGRGVLALVDSVSDCAFDATDKSRDAILVGGSDDAGTAAAVTRLVEILTAK